ncbi:unnamed protein product [Adineta steineri]|uniref:ubiquitinyl hydrolase 1 n=2 Tax=Adineta steineri TaxID=433720 RepID=A0A819LEL1_9BILA|nr:unnamed protein product [Adineta steineri]
MDESILNHLFLPHYLPSSADHDHLSKENHLHEHEILEFINEYFDCIKLTEIATKLPVFPILTDCIHRWSRLQSPHNFAISNIQSTIEHLPPGNFLPLYFHMQNAAILIEIDENNSYQPLISAWKVLLSSASITSSIIPHFSCFPVKTYRLRDRSELISKVHCELLIDFMYNTIEYSKSIKSSNIVDEIREVPKSHYVCKWWIDQFEGIEAEEDSHNLTQFKKKHRDQIRWYAALVPFRRSGLWMTIKVVIHTILNKHLKDLGTVVYKLLMTHLLTHVICTRQTSIDLLVHCTRKIVRRLHKIDKLLMALNTTKMNTWIIYTKQQIELKINQIIPKPNWQDEIKMNEILKRNSLLKDLNSIKYRSVSQYWCGNLKAYLNNNNFRKTSVLYKNKNNSDDSVNLNENDYIPSYNFLTNQMKCTIDIALISMEIWTELCLEQWINRSLSTVNGNHRFAIILDFYETYQKVALTHYCLEQNLTDPIGYSRFILTSLTVIYCLHRKLCQHKMFERLQLHSIHIPNLIELFEFLVLPNRNDMIRARNLYDYFNEFRQKQYPDLLHDIKSENAFGVYFAARSQVMNESINKIRIQVEKDKQDKIREVASAKEKHEQLMDEIKNQPCKCRDDSHSKQCVRYKTVEKAKQMKVSIFESPLPLQHESALAVIFELQMPIEIRCYRDIIWQFINRLQTKPQEKIYEWLNVLPHKDKLKAYYTGPRNPKVKLVSRTKSMNQSHYSSPPSVGSTPLENFLLENGLKVEISATTPIEFEDECRILTPQLDHSDYKQLQYAINNTRFVQNDVIAHSSACSTRLKPKEFVEYGSFRSGHRLQWWNLLIILEMDSLSVAEESVAILIIHSLLQYGPLTVDSMNLSHYWCPESHQQLLQDHFVDELILRLDHRLNECELNWQNELALMVIVIITMRILTICNSTKENEVIRLVKKCRKIGEKWVDLITESIRTISRSAFDEIEKLRLKVINVSVSCILTFSTHEDRINYLLSSNEDLIFLLKAATTIHDSIILITNRSDIKVFMNNMIRFSQRVLVIVQPTIEKFLCKTSYESLNEFTVMYWTVMKGKEKMKGCWKKRKRYSFDGWYDCQYRSRCISIDCIKGAFLVDGMTIGFLPEKIIFDDLFIRVFGQHVFEVQAAELPNTYITKHSYHSNRQVLYEFHLNNETNQLVIRERRLDTNDIFQLVHYKYFQTELPDIFVSNYSHWWNTKNQLIEFRPVAFQDVNFLKNKFYILSLDTGDFVTNNGAKKQTLVNQSSPLFQTLFLRYFIRLDDQSYVYMMQDNASQADPIIDIHLSRLRIAFQYNMRTTLIASREYSNMYVDENQWLGTLTGLTFGLLLSPLPIDNHRLNYYPYRKLIVPFGKIDGVKTPNNQHQTVTIQRRRTSSDEFLCHYFVFILNDQLGILQSTDSPTGWLYLALLHAITSNLLPDQYTGMTGMERAFQLLNSAACWSDQPFDSLSLDILTQIAAISPIVHYYPAHLTCMQQIEWNSNGLEHSMQHFGYYLIASHLIKNSQQLNFMHSSSVSNEIPKLFKEKLNDEALLKKLYWDYRDSYNPTARLSVEIEVDILHTVATESCSLTSKLRSSATNDPISSLVDDLYSKGNVNLEDCSNRNWLPLSQWVNEKDQLKNIWVGLLAFAVRSKSLAAEGDVDKLQQFVKLVDFIHFISPKCTSKLFYLQLLKTASKVPIITLKSIIFPPFIEYQYVGEVSVVENRFKFTKSQNSNIRNQIITEIQRCWTMNINYQGVNNLSSPAEISEINMLLKSWRSNGILQSFLADVKQLLSSFPTEQFHTKVSTDSQQFIQESPVKHHRIQLECVRRSIDNEMLSKAERKFHHPYSDPYKKCNVSVPFSQLQNEFPEQIFPFVNEKDNSLNAIENYFQNQLAESWIKFRAEEKCEKECPSIQEINELLNSIQEESIQFWDELSKSITLSNELSFNTGLVTRITPTTLIRILQQETMMHCEKTSSFDLSNGQRTLLGGAIVNWILEQQIVRALHFANHQKYNDFKTELSNIPHSNWTPSEHVSWLILELEMNIIIRDIQITVARHMMQSNTSEADSTTKNIVMQLNMGEGKTSVILPMLAVSLSSTNSCFVRIIVLKSLFPTNYQSLRYKLGGLLNRRIFSFACRRDMNLKNEHINQILERLKQGLCHNDVMLTSPEDILSFDLLTIDKCRRKEFDISQSMLIVQRWLKAYARDVLDESDEILHIKYQLVYTVGDQKQVDAGAERWKTIQSILELVKKHAAEISNRFSEKVCYKPSERKSAFPQFRLQSHHPYSVLCENIAHDWIESRNCRNTDKEIILSFILKTNLLVEDLVGKFPSYDIQLFLIVRGLLSSEILLFALKKRYRVSYGVTLDSSFHRLMAVPFRAKDVAADRTEFGHPDIALVLTHLSYYYSGLNDCQLTQCFDRLSEKENDAETIYEQWILYEEQDGIPASITKWKSVNFKDYHQRIHCIFPTFRHNMLVINYFLNHFVFPREAKEFPYKIVSSAWDLSSDIRSKPITGFSGTNDTQLLLPVHIRQYDLFELRKTDAVVVNNLLQNENENYQSLSINATSEDILNQISNYKDNINVILDVGALFVDGINRDIAVKWLNLSRKDKIDYVVYFDSDSIFVCDRQFHFQPFETSPASERLDHCVFYLDEIHTRGTDFKFPNGFRAVLTLGNGLTKDRFVQACMRMRKLGNGHSLTFWSSNEVHQQIVALKIPITKQPIGVIDILRWLYQNTVHATWEALNYWAEQSLSYQRKLDAFQYIEWQNHENIFTNNMMKDLANRCLEPEITELTRMYGVSRELRTIADNYIGRYKECNYKLSTETHDAVLKRLNEYNGTKQRLCQLLDEEQQRELEQELEAEQQLARPLPGKPHKPILNEEIKSLCNENDPRLNLSRLSKVFRSLSFAFDRTPLFNACQPSSWQRNLWVSTEFQRVVKSTEESLSSFLRPPRWIVVYRNEDIIFVSAFEANWLMGQLQSNKSSVTTLRLLLPRTKRVQSIFVNTPTLMIPPSIELSNTNMIYYIPVELLVQLFVFNGTLYFETVDEQIAYCQCLGLCPKPWTTKEEEAFENGWISIDGFVQKPKHRLQLQLNQARFPSNPLTFIKQLIETRNNSHPPITSHVGSIIFNSHKLL